MTTTKHTMLPLASIRIDGGTQARAAINQETVAQYAADLGEGASFPPVVVFFDGLENWLADGFHRVHSHRQAGRVEIAAEVREGTLREAIEFACSANAHHGLPRTNADKRRAVEMLLADEEWAALSDRELAKKAGVSHMLVAAVRDPDAAQRQKDKRDASARKRVASDASGGNAPPPAPPGPIVTDAGANVASDATPTKTEAEQLAEDAHGGTSLESLLTETQRDLEAAQKTIAACEADDTKAEVVKARRLAEHAERRNAELMENAAKSQQREKWVMNQLRRCGKAIGEDDPDKIAPAVEAFVRANKKQAVPA